MLFAALARFATSPKTVSILVDDTSTGALLLGAQLVSIFQQAGWQHSELGDDHLWADMPPGISVRGPKHHKGADFLARQFRLIFGSPLVSRVELLDLPADPFVIQISIGKKPYAEVHV